jgi:ribonucleoside-diphosphate reductase alpha chain
VDSLRHMRVVEKFGLDIYETNAPFGTMNDLREKVKRGMRNSTLLAIAPTATIANIIGTTQATELPWKDVFTKKNLSGTFKYLAHTIVNNPFNLPFKSTRDIDQLWTVWAAAARQIWVDQAQSINYFLSSLLADDEIGDSLDNMYRESWKCGNKTSYYLYGQAEENEVQLNPSMAVHADPTVPVEPEETGGRFCSIDAGPDCEACS